MSRSTVPKWLQSRLLIVMGDGGVGKTSTSAALAMAVTRRNQRSAVITFDPARRLRDALSLPSIGGSPIEVPLPGVRGSLHAMALDTKSTFDDLIRHFTSDTSTAERILSNPLYIELARGLGGAGEYMAMEKLHQLLREGSYDTIVVDTPPSAHAADLLGAPQRIGDLISSGAASVLRSPSSILEGRSGGLARSVVRALLAALERIIGPALVRNLSDFATAFEPLLHGFRHRAGEIADVLRRDDTGFVLVSTPHRDTLESTMRLRHGLLEQSYFVAGLIANRCERVTPLRRHKVPKLEAATLRKLEAIYRTRRGIARTQAARLAEIRRNHGAVLLAQLPALPHPVSSLADLQQLARELEGRS